MIDITGNDIAELGDADLRTLIGLLCESELCSMGLPTAGVTWGGHQNAKDGGIDVRVNISSTTHEDSYIPRAKTGFQVKKPDMPYNSIIAEMRPNGELRQVIKDLVDVSGAYIIVSSQGSTSDSALRNRRMAMEKALDDYPNASNMKVDFYDRERIAAWSRCHPSIVIWIRDKIGRPIQGWKNYGNWSNASKEIEDEYLLDKHARLHNCRNQDYSHLSVVDGINEIREILHSSSSSVRLVGLSGVGKTRLLQSLFDQRIGKRPLNKSQVLYCDIGDNPIPEPINFVERLIALKKYAIIAIDNCPPKLHRSLSSLCTKPDSLISLITVEYDIREDQPEETEVYRLEPASTDVIKKIILSRFKYISEIDSNTIARFSGGNSRIAIALANTIQKGESLASLKDEELFVRLFQQRNVEDKSLLRAAEVCSLVYSFDAQTMEGTNNELKVLGSLCEMSVRELYRNVSELKRRDLVQQRGAWRAVLPHAVANKLAKRALENIPLDDIYSIFENKSAERLLKSFSRRLSYLHECSTAIKIAQKWLCEDGLLGDVIRLNELGVSIFQNIAPVNPELTLAAFERASNHKESNKFFSRNNNHYLIFTRILRSLAYDKKLFNRSVELLCRFALSEKPGENYNSIRDLVKSLFYIYLSGTHATIEQRIFVISNLINSNNNENVNLGISLLSASLEAYEFNYNYEFEFGSRSRDYGYTPRNKEEIKCWFKTFIEYSVTLINFNDNIAPRIKSLLAEKFCGLWTKFEMYDELEIATKEIHSKSSWNEGWIAVRFTKKFNGKDIKKESLSRLNYLDVFLNPDTLIEKVKLYIFSGCGNTLDLSDTIETEDDCDEDLIIEDIVRSLGREVSKNEGILKQLLKDILSKEGNRLFYFGQGLADGTKNPEKMWQDFCIKLTCIEKSKRKYQMLCGFLNRISELDEKLSEKFLDDAITDENLASAYPLLQVSVKITEIGVDRLKRSVKIGLAPILLYRNLAYGSSNETICDHELIELLRLIAAKDDGLKVAIKILQMRFHRISTEKTFSDEIVSLGRELILNYEFSREANMRTNLDYELSKIINICFKGEASENYVRKFCRKIIEANLTNKIYFSNYREVMKVLAINQPIIFLDVFLEENTKNQISSLNLIRHKNPIDYIANDVLIKWCEVNPETRYPILSYTIIPYRISEKKNKFEWGTLARLIINSAPNPIEVLDKFISSFTPNSWSGSLAEAMQSKLCLILELKEHENSLIRSWAFNTEKVFNEEIRYIRERELKRESELNECFE
ncbi:hypothetical protein [Clostridium saccharoperbutylacetonicum]